MTSMLAGLLAIFLLKCYLCSWASWDRQCLAWATLLVICIVVNHLYIGIWQPGIHLSQKMAFAR